LRTGWHAGEESDMAKTIGDYPQVSKAHQALIKTYSNVFFTGPPISDELVALIEHMFTEEEADVVQHIKPWRFKTAASIASSTGRPLQEVKDILNRLAHDKYVIYSLGQGGKAHYFILPIIPGTFEAVLMRVSPDGVSPWLKRFAELFEALFATGFIASYHHKPVGAVRYLPVGEVVQAQPMALPSDRLEYIMERHKDFAVGVCQCRLSKQLVGDGCDRMLETCTFMGDFATMFIREGRMRRSSMREVLEIKAEAEKQGLVTWTMNDESTKFFKAACSCCGCCCTVLRVISDFNTPGLVAPPHFIPGIDAAACACCGKCVEICPMKAMVVIKEGEGKRHIHKNERCIGCGLCVVACPNKALAMVELPGYKNPPANTLAYMARYGHNFSLNTLYAWSSRRRVNKTG
jgi:H+/Na+-translocating ferredoxin:NAD+ oxidoreductase subunit B